MAKLRHRAKFRRNWSNSCRDLVITRFLANVNSTLVNVRYMLSPIRLSSVGNARVPYSGRCNFRQYLYGIWYVGRPLTSTKNFMEIVPGEPLHRGS